MSPTMGWVTPDTSDRYHLLDPQSKLSDTDPTLTMDAQSPEQEVEGPAAGSPSDFLKNIVGKKVKVRIGSGIDYHGKCGFSRIQ